MSRRVILFVDNNEIKVVTGSMVISTPLEQVGLPHRKAYFDNLFATSEVVWVTGLEILNRDVFFGMVGVSVQAPPPAVALPVVQPQQTTQPMAPQVAMLQPRMMTPQVQQPQQFQQQEQQLPRTVVSGPPPQKKVFEDGNKWIVAESEATIIVDDLPTGGQVRNSGRAATLALIPGKPVNLARFDSEAIRKSSILKSLARAGIVKPIPSDVAHRMLAKFEDNENRSFSAKEVAAYEGSSGDHTDFVGGRSVGSDAAVIDLDHESNYQDSDVDSMRQIMHEIDLSEEERMIQREESTPENSLTGIRHMERPRSRLNRSGVGSRAPTNQYVESDDIEMLQ
jgi:hypothetical protein